MISEPILKGPHHAIVYVAEQTGNAETFLGLAESLRAKGPLADRLLDRKTKPKDSPREWKELLAIMDRTVKYGLDVVARNPKKCRRSFQYGNSEIGEFKSNHVRAMFFEDPEFKGLIVITHCFSKKVDETPQSEIDRAKRIRATYLTSRPKQSGAGT